MIVKQVKDDAFRWLLGKSEEIFVQKLERNEIILKLLATPYLDLNWDMRDDGIFFASIDDNELFRFQLIMNEIFGQKNFISNIVVQSNPRGSQASTHIAETHEYILVYCKDIRNALLMGETLEDRTISQYGHEDSDGRKYRMLGLRQRGGAWKREDRPKMFYPIYVNPESGRVNLEKDEVYSVEVLPKRPTGEESRWTWSPEKSSQNIEYLVGREIKRDDGVEWDIYRKDYLVDESGNERRKKTKSIWLDKEMNYQAGRNEIKKLFQKDVFDYPKPTDLVKRCIEISTRENDIVLDSFAGSPTGQTHRPSSDRCDRQTHL